MYSAAEGRQEGKGGGVQEEERRPIDGVQSQESFLSLGQRRGRDKDGWKRMKREREGDDRERRRVTDNMGGSLTGAVGSGRR